MKLKVAPFFLLALVLVLSLVLTVEAEDTTANSSSSGSTVPTTTATSSATTNQGERTLIKQAINTIQTDFQKHKQEFRLALLKIKDERRRTLVDTIDTKISNLNTLRTTRLTQALKQMDGIATKLDTRIATAKQAGQDTSSAEAALTAARSAITSAQDAVASQAAKTYTIQITDDTAIKLNVDKVISQLRIDLQTVYQEVLNAKKALQTAILAVYHLQSTK